MKIVPKLHGPPVLFFFLFVKSELSSCSCMPICPARSIVAELYYTLCTRTRWITSVVTPRFVCWWDVGVRGLPQAQATTNRIHFIRGEWRWGRFIHTHAAFAVCMSDRWSVIHTYYILYKYQMLITYSNIIKKYDEIREKCTNNEKKKK